MNSSVMLEGHLKATIARGRQSTDAYLLAVQDTTFYNYSTHKGMEGLGKIQGEVKGIAQHNMLLFNELGLPLGVIDQQYWSRKGSVTFEGKESQKWHRGLLGVNKNLADIGKKVVVIQDREADIFSFFKADRSEGIELIVRVHQPRNLEAVESGVVGKLTDFKEHILEMGYKQVSITRGGKQVHLTLALKACRLKVLPDKDLSAAKHKTQALSLVIAQEIAAIDEHGVDVFNANESALWYLLSSLPIDHQEDIERIVSFYSLRWRIERFHYTLKSGALNVEKLQFDDLQTTINALSFYSIVAWQLLALTYLIRQDNEAEANTCFEENDIELLGKLSKKPIQTVKQATLALTKIIGFTPSKKQPMPGVKVLSLALQRFYYLKLGYMINQT